LIKNENILDVGLATRAYPLPEILNKIDFPSKAPINGDFY
jgi:hypothetical protein